MDTMIYDKKVEEIVPADWVVSDSIIKVFGVGGGGCNSVDYMYRQGIQGCSFVACNTDSQALQKCSVPIKIQMGAGLGAGTNPEKGRKAAIESQDDISRVLNDKTKMVFITAGMGGGTGTGAAPVIAKMAKDKGILTVAVVTLPFSNEGKKAYARAIDGVHELERNVDSLLIINNEKLYDYFGDLLLHDAFPKTDEVVATAVRGIVEIIKKTGYINVDFEDVKTMMKNSGMALMGCGSGSGPNRIDDAIKEAFECPLLNDFDLKTSKSVLINITTGNNDLGLKANDMKIINDKIDEYTGGANNFKHGLIFDDDPNIGDTIHITAIATGFEFNTLLGADVDLGKLIIIDKDFEYDKEKLSLDGGIVLGSAETRPTPATKRTFHFNDGYIPAILAASGDEITELENIPAISRKHNSNQI